MLLDPSITPPTMTAFQLSSNGLVIGGVDNVNDPYPLVQSAGLDMPPVRSSDTPRAYEHGSFVGWDLYGPRTVLAQVIVRAWQGQSIEQQMLKLRAAFPLGLNSEYPLFYNNSIQTLAMSVRCRKMPYQVDVETQIAGGKVVEIALQSCDPRTYSSPTATLTLGSY